MPGSRALFWFLPIYAAALLLAAPRLSFWLDEVLTLSGALEPDLTSMLVNLEKQQGATPLAFLLPRWAVELFGFTPVSARLPSILAAVAACPGVYLLARRAGLANPFFATLVFALWPLEIRYALEVRPYAAAVCLGVWLTVALLDRYPWPWYALLTVALGLTHPYGLFVPLAHVLWLFFHDRRRTLVPGISLVFVTAILIPWYLHFSEGWSAISQQQQLGLLNWRAILVFVREISGSGYIGAALLFAGAIPGARRMTTFWRFALFVPLLAVPFANVVFDYFFAIRQLIYLLPVLALMFASGVESLGIRGRILAAAFLAASLYSNGAWLTRPREDWAAAANAAAQEVARGACVRFVADSAKLFVVFQPELSNHICQESPDRAVLAGSTYELESDDRAARDWMARHGLSKKSSLLFVAPRIEVYSR